MSLIKLLCFSMSLLLLNSYAYAQVSEISETYEIGGLKVEGAIHTDQQLIISVSGLKIGEAIQLSGEKASQAIKNLWQLKLFTDVQIVKEKTQSDVIFLIIKVTEHPRLLGWTITNIKKAKKEELNKLIEKYLQKGTILTAQNKALTRTAIRNFYIQKGYADVKITLKTEVSTLRTNYENLLINIQKGQRVKVQDIIFMGNQEVKSSRLRRLFPTKRKKALFTSSKLIPEEIEEGKKAVTAYYQTLGFLDAGILEDSLYREGDGDYMLLLTIDEGHKYYFGNITWKGNAIYTDATLSKVLGIQKGDIYNPVLLENRLRFSVDGRDISSLYMDDGYLFFNAEVVPIAIRGNTIDIEIQILEGAQAVVEKVIIKGNDRTHEEIIRRELRTQPGEKFSRSDIIRSQREIINLGYFNPEKLGINTSVNPERGTVDVEYTVEERNSDQFEVSAGYGGPNVGVTGTLGVTFNNFSFRNLLKKETWQSLPTGDGQRLSLRAQTNGKAYQSYNISFTEPWLGGKKAMPLSIASYFNKYTNGVNGTESFGQFSIFGATASLGTRLKFPDDNFVSNTAINFQRYSLDNWLQGLFRMDDGKIVSDGRFNNLSISQTFSRSTIDNPIFPKSGSRFSLAMQFTPPWSLFSNNNDNEGDNGLSSNWLEYHKWRFDAEWYTTIVGDLVLKASAKFGFLGRYNRNSVLSPFERFQLGGDGISNNGLGSFTGTDIIALRGYEIDDLENNLIDGNVTPTPVFNKFTLELRYPLSLNPNATIYGLAFLEAGNAWQSLRDFNPFDVKRSAGLGLRVFLPMFGTLGFDYGIGFDKTGDKTLNNYGKFSIILGIEPD